MFTRSYYNKVNVFFFLFPGNGLASSSDKKLMHLVGMAFHIICISSSKMQEIPSNKSSGSI